MKKSRRAMPPINTIIYIFIAFVGVYLLFVTIRSLRQSFILDSRDRVNVVFYGQETLFLSFGLTDEVNYIMTFNPDHEVQVPGGYLQYPIGSLGRLAEIERNPSIIQRSFSSAISGYVDYYVAPKRGQTYSDKKDEEPDFRKGKLIPLIFSTNYQTNMNTFDKLYVASLISKKRQSDFIPLSSVPKQSDSKDVTLFYENGFQKKYKGFFFHKSLREEGYAVQILYDSYGAAKTISRIIEGEGIRVVDLSQLDEARAGRCTIQHNIKTTTKTVRFLAKQFGCTIEKSDVEGSDIILVLGKRLESEWK